MQSNNKIDKALDELATSRGKLWNIGMELPPGLVPNLNYGKKRKTQLEVASTENAFGKQWVCDFPKEPGNPEDPKQKPEDEEWDDIPKVRGNEIVAAEVMRLTGTRYFWMIAVNHDVKLCYDEDGQRIPIWENGKRDWKTEPADEHITLRLGMDSNTCMLHGHVYVTVDESNNPTGFMKKEDRKYISMGDDRVLELWVYTGSPNAGMTPSNSTVQTYRRKARKYRPGSQSKPAKPSRSKRHANHGSGSGLPSKSAKPHRQNPHSARSGVHKRQARSRGKPSS